jgi:hypothetical protein
LRSDSGFRTNLGFTSVAGVDTSAVVHVYREDGNELGQVDVDLPAAGFVQLFRLLSNHLSYEGVAWASVACDDADAAYNVYASVVDGATGDPYYVPPVVVETD